MITRRSLLSLTAAPALLPAASSKTKVEICGNQFFINSQPTYKGRTYKGLKIEGLLSFTLNLQGGSPEGYSKSQPWQTSGIAPDGTLLPDFMARLERILDRADQLGMAPIVGYFYFGQDQVLKDEAAVLRAVENSTNWLLYRKYRNVLVEVNNETNVKAYHHEILKPARINELIDLVKGMNRQGRLLTGTSYGGNGIPRENVVQSSGYRPMPILFNENELRLRQTPKQLHGRPLRIRLLGLLRSRHQRLRRRLSMSPRQLGINLGRKKAFFNLLRDVTGA